VDITPSSLIVILKETNMHDFLWCVSSNWIKRTKGNCSCTIAQLHNCIGHIIAISHNTVRAQESTIGSISQNIVRAQESTIGSISQNTIRAQESTIGSDHILHPISIMHKRVQLVPITHCILSVSC
jgi:hypothetical protein